MLVLSRKVDETLTIDTPAGPVTVMVVKVEGKENVHLGITAPKSFAIHRDEAHVKRPA